MWSPLAAALAKDHRVAVPDLRGMGLSSKPEGGYDKKTQAADIRAVLDKLGIDKADIVATTSAPWWPMHTPCAIPTRPPSWS